MTKSEPRLPKTKSKSHTSAAGLLGRTGSGGLGGVQGLALNKPAAAIPAHDLPASAPRHNDHTGPNSISPPAKHTGKAETRRPTGRAISGS